ncbi:MAG: hypothetical protein L0I76_37450, partial [Pseudonocardia sp.]|nr:hypothetical protein [Pseudonocardia sp.]
MSRSGPPDTTRPDHDPEVTFTPHDPPRISELLLDDSPVALGDALPLLRAREDVWGAVTALSLDLVARGAITATVSPAGYDAWAAAPDPADEDRLRRLSGADADRQARLRAFCDAVADTLPRSGDDHGAYAGKDLVRVGRTGPEHVATDAVRLSLRVEST